MSDESTTKTPEQLAAEKADAEKNKAKLVPESDLLAVKGAKEGLEKKLKETEDGFKSKLSETETKLFSSEAKIKELEGKLSQANLSAEELKKVKEQLDTAQKRSGELETKALEFRRRIIAATYNIPPETVNNKTMEQLDHYEEALKAVAATRQPAGGGFAAGGGGGTGGTESRLDRAKRIIAEHEEKSGAMRVKGATPK